MIKIVVPEIQPSNNKFMGRGSKNYQAYTYQSEKKKWVWLIQSAIKIKKKQKPIEKAVVNITYYFPDKRRRDPDNYSGKFVLDGLIRAGIIKDDSFDHIVLNLKGKVDKKNPRTEIKIMKDGNMWYTFGGKKINLSKIVHIEILFDKGKWLVIVDDSSESFDNFESAKKRFNEILHLAWSACDD